MRRFLCVLAFVLLLPLTSLTQQTDVRQFTFIGGYSYLATPSLNLASRGFNVDLATNARSWLSLGFDFSAFNGYSTLVPTYLNTATQTKLARMLPAGFPVSAVAVPYDSSIFTYQLGPQLNYRKLRKVTFFVRPALGLLHAKIQTNPSASASPIVKALLGGKLSAADNTVFYGFGGGASWEITPHFGLRMTADFARYNFFDDVLNGPRHSVRLSVTPKISFGKNILRVK